MLSKEVENIKNLKVYYGANVAISYNTLSQEVRIHPRYGKSKPIGMGIRTFLKVAKMLKKLEEIGIDSDWYIERLVKEWNSWAPVVRPLVCGCFLFILTIH